MTTPVVPTYINPLPPAPEVTDSVPEFDSKAFPFVEALVDLTGEINATVAGTYQNALAAGEGAVASTTSAGVATTAKNDAVIAKNAAQAAQVAAEAARDDALTNTKGWSPMLRLENDGDRRVLFVYDWTGGAGTKPSVTGYIGASGLTPNKSLAVDVRGKQGLPGTGGDLMQILGGFDASNQTPITDTDTLLRGIGKAQGQIDKANVTLASAVLSYPDYDTAAAAAAELPDGQVVVDEVGLAQYKTSGGGLEFDNPVPGITFSTRAGFVAHPIRLLAPDGYVITAGGLSYQRVGGSTAIGDLPGWEPLTIFTTGPDARHWGFVGDGTMADTQRVNEGLDWIGQKGGGQLQISQPGQYLVTNTNPYNPADWGGVSEKDANWWANRRAIYIRYNNTRLFLGHGVTLKMADGGNAHCVQIGQFGLGIGVPYHAVEGCGVVGSGWLIDMNGANQLVATATHDHPAGIIVTADCHGTDLRGGRVKDSAYYGVAFEGGEGTDKSFQRCKVSDLVIEACRADGFDAKDFASKSAYNYIRNVVSINCGYGGNDFLTPQAGIDLRGGWKATECYVIYTDGFTGARVGIRVQEATTPAESADPTIVDKCVVLGSGRYTETIAFRMAARLARATNNRAVGMNEAYRLSAPNVIHFGNSAYDCGTMARFIGGGAFDADGIQWIGGLESGCDIAWSIDAGVSGVKILQGYTLSASTPLIDNGSGTTIQDVTGFATKSRVAVSIPVSSTGVKTVTVAHGLKFTPLLSDISVSLQVGGNVFDYALGNLVVSEVDATNVTVVANVIQASATGSSSVLARIIVDGKR